jgi:hypothetical protein
LRYDNDPKCTYAKDPSTDKPVVCLKTFTIAKDIPGPLYVYYQLDNFYQNHRRYVKSRSFSQLKGEGLSVKDISSDCDPINTMGDLPGKTFLNGKAMTADDLKMPANPCGLVAKSFFNDSYSLYSGAYTDPDSMPASAKQTINSKDIAWESDRKYKFAHMKTNIASGKTYKDYQWLDVTDGKKPPNIIT